MQDVTNINQKLEEENRKTNVLLSEKTSEYDIVAKENGRLCEELGKNFFKCSWIEILLSWNCSC